MDVIVTAWRFVASSVDTATVSIMTPGAASSPTSSTIESPEPSVASEMDAVSGVPSTSSVSEIVPVPP